MTTITPDRMLGALDGLRLDETDNGPIQARIPIAKVGRYKDRRYGKFAITEAQAEGWGRNLRETFGGRVPIDFDHSPEKGRGSEAAAWIVGLAIGTGATFKAEDAQQFGELDDDTEYVVANTEWTPQGAQAVRDGRWRYVSPTFHDRYRDESGADRGPALLGAGLTNRPFLRKGMPAITLTDDFETAYTRALDDGRLVNDDLRHHWEQIAESNPALAIKTLDSLSANPRSARVTTTSVDEHGRALLPVGTDLDELLADEIAPRKAWRVLREMDDRARREGGELSGYPSYEPDPTPRFLDEWRIYVDSGRDLVGTIRYRVERAEEEKAARRQAERDDRAAAEEARTAQVKREVKTLAEDMRAYAEHVADCKAESDSWQQVTPLTFDAFQGQLIAERLERERG